MENFNQEKSKNFYSLNLSEGKIFIIFTIFIIVVAGLIFATVFLYSNNKKADNKISVENLKDKNNENFSYYSELNPEDKNKVNIENEKKDAISNNNNKQETEKEDGTKESNDKKSDNSISLKEKSNNQNIEDNVKLDNSKALYSSDYSNSNIQQEKKVDNKKETAKTQINKDMQKSNLKKVEKKTAEEKYIVQIGSYINKKTAEEISLFYKIQGFPAYIVEKKNNEKTFYRLRIGPYKEKNKAEENLASIKKTKYGENCFISKVYL